MFNKNLGYISTCLNQHPTIFMSKLLHIYIEYVAAIFKKCNFKLSSVQN